MSYGSGTPGFGKPTYFFASYSYPAIARVLDQRQLTITVSTATDGRTAIAAVALDLWDIPRPAYDVVPARAHVLDITISDGKGHTTRRLHVTSLSKVRQIARLIDALPHAQPGGVYNCPNETYVPGSGAHAQFAFRARTNSAVLAAVDAPDNLAPTGPCTGEITFMLRHEQPIYLLGQLIGPAQQILRTRLVAS